MKYCRLGLLKYRLTRRTRKNGKYETIWEMYNYNLQIGFSLRRLFFKANNKPSLWWSLIRLNNDGYPVRQKRAFVINGVLFSIYTSKIVEIKYFTK